MFLQDGKFFLKASFPTVSECCEGMKVTLTIKIIATWWCTLQYMMTERWCTLQYVMTASPGVMQFWTGNCRPTPISASHITSITLLHHYCFVFNHRYIFSDEQALGSCSRPKIDVIIHSYNLIDEKHMPIMNLRTCLNQYHVQRRESLKIMYWSPKYVYWIHEYMNWQEQATTFRSLFMFLTVIHSCPIQVVTNNWDLSLSPRVTHEKARWRVSQGTRWAPRSPELTRGRRGLECGHAIMCQYCREWTRVECGHV